MRGWPNSQHCVPSSDSYKSPRLRIRQRLQRDKGATVLWNALVNRHHSRRAFRLTPFEFNHARPSILSLSSNSMVTLIILNHILVNDETLVGSLWRTLGPRNLGAGVALRRAALESGQRRAALGK